MSTEFEKLSVVIPVYNDQEVLDELLKRLTPAVTAICQNYEVILIDDGSRDKSWAKIEELKQQYENIVAVKLARNFGQQNAIAAGLDQATGDVIVLMDSDLQDRPEDIHVLVNALFEHNSTMAIAQWESRKDSFFKVFVSRLFFFVSDHMTEIHVKPRLGIFRAMRSSVVRELKKFPETTATTISLLYYIGHGYVAVPLKRDARFAGKSGYNLKKMLQLTLARLLSFSMLPLRFTTYTGLGLALMSFLLAIFWIIRKLILGAPTGWTSLIVVTLFLFGLNFAFLGILGEYIGKVFVEVKRRPKYVVDRIEK